MNKLLKPLFTVVTVVYNGAATIETTIKSILAQKFVDYEYIIMDSCSNDDTAVIIKKLLPFFENRMHYICEKDKGIYDAMNKSINIANGKYILFINSGDELNNEDSLSYLSKYIKNEDYEFIYSNVAVIDDNRNVLEEIKYPTKITPLFLLNKMICHQSTVYLTRSLKEYQYNTDYKIVADYDLLIRMFFDHKIFKYVDFTLSKYLAGGESFKKLQQQIFERERIHDEVIKNVKFIKLTFYILKQRLVKKINRIYVFREFYGCYKKHISSR